MLDLNKFRYLNLILLVSLFFCYLNPLEANTIYPQARVGFSEIPFHDDLQNAQRSLLVWYPIEELTPVTQSSNPWDLFYIGKNAPIIQNKKLPVIFISHGWNGIPNELSWLVRELVYSGFIVVGIQHRDIIDGKIQPNHWMRAQDISTSLDHFISSPFGKSVDLNKIGIAGFSLGGTTALLISGGRATKLNNIVPSPEYTESDDFKKVSELLPILNKEMLSKDWKDSRIKAAFIMAPSWAWIFDEQSLKNITIPIYIVAGANDEVIKTSTNAQFFAKFIPKSIYQEIPGKVGHFVFITNLNGKNRATVDPMGKLNFLFNDDESVDRTWIQQRVASEAVHFFQNNL